MVTTKKKEGGTEFPMELKDNQCIHIIKVKLYNKYDSDEKTYGRCRYKKVIATTNEGVTFLLWDDDRKISNARQYGSGDDPRSWGN